MLYPSDLFRRPRPSRLQVVVGVSALAVEVAILAAAETARGLADTANRRLWGER